MMKKVIISITLVVLIVSLISSVALASSAPVKAMEGLKGEELTDETGKMGKLINTAIALIQVSGTGISLIMCTILGIKYLLAAPSDKADVKRQIFPLLIGAVILFASVNLVGIISRIADTTLKNAVG